MVRGYYTAVSGMVTQEKKLNVHANNIANVSTSGFKRDGLITGTFGEHIATRMDQYKGEPVSQIGPGVFMATTVDEYTDYSQGIFEFTQSPYNVAIQGDGYFVIRSADGTESLTRNGQFGLDAEGYLVLPGYGRVQGEGGDILLENQRFTIDDSGMIFLADEEGGEPDETDRILTVMPQGDENAFKKANNELFEAMDGYLQLDPDTMPTKLLHGAIERANVSVADEMSLIIATQRSLQSCSQIVKMYDELTDTANSRISRVQ